MVIKSGANDVQGGTQMPTVKELREKANMTRPQFCEYFGIPYRSMQDWELGNRNCPGYLISLMEYKLIKEGFIRADMMKGE
jgi:DNA-binding transcriptional regulator YiaG